MKDFSQIFDIIYKKYCTDAINHKAEPGQISKRSFMRFLEVSQGKMQAWEKGQWPVAEDLEKIAKLLGFSYRWLITGEGDPEEDDTGPHKTKAVKASRTLRNANGQLVGDLLHDIIRAELKLSFSDFAQSVGLTAADLQELLDSRRPPTWEEMTAMWKIHGINASFLLTGKGEDLEPYDELERAAKAVGRALDMLFLHDMFEMTFDEATEFLAEREKRKQERLEKLIKNNKNIDDLKPLPRMLSESQIAALREKCGIYPAWLLYGQGQSHEIKTKDIISSKNSDTQKE